MSARRPEGAALLVAGYGAPGVGAFDASAVHTLGQIGEALLATGTPWQIRRLTATAGDRNAADRRTLKRSLMELSQDPVRVAVLVLLGRIIEVNGELALVTGDDAHEYPEDATLPLSFLRDRLELTRAEQLVVAISARGEGGPLRWLGALGTERSHHIIAVDAPESGNPIADALLAGLCGEALDPRTGTVTMASLSTHLTRHAQTVQASNTEETIAQPPPLAGLWDVRRSQLANRPRPVRADEPEDLTGTVLPGRFRLDRVVARGTFGTVYCARQLAVERDVAVKVLHADIDPSSEDGKLFVHEIRNVGRIDHAHVVRMLQADITHDGRLFFAMELLDGSDLERLGREARLAAPRAIELVRQLLDGLGAAHDAGLVHADIKPANAIVVARNGKLRTGEMEPLGKRPSGDEVLASGSNEGADAAKPDGVAAGSAHATVAAGSAHTADATAAAGSAADGATTAAGSAAITADGATTAAGSADTPHGAKVATPDASSADGTKPKTGALGSTKPTESKFPTPPRGSQPSRTNGAPSERVVLVDFGLARLRSPDRPAESAGGTPAYMAPEQLNEGRVDARSDLFSASLVLFWLITGWRRPNAATLIPPMDLIADPELRAILARALDKDPVKRFQSARELSAALTGSAPIATPEVTPLLPFRHLAPMTGEDRGRLHGRETDLALITEHVLYRRSVIYTAPSGTGKTSLLCAGLMPRLEYLGIHAIYHRCRADNAALLAAAIDPAAPDLASAIESFHKHRGGKLVIVVDQLEAALGDPHFVTSLLAFDRWPRDADISVLLSVREDYLARLVARSQELEPNIPVVRLPPLTPDGAREAIVTPLAEARLAIEPALLEALLSDFQRAAAAIGPEMGWGSTPAVFPPHLQLACSVLYDESKSRNTGLTLDHYRKLGGFDAIVGEHLERVIETELDNGRDLIARDLFVELVTSSSERAVRPESELLSITNSKHEGNEVLAVLEILRSRGLLVRVRGDGEPSWELIHDSLVPRVLAWIDRKDLARRRAIELVRYHLRRSTREAPSLLGRRELRELKRHRAVLDDLETEWRRRDDAAEIGWTPKELVARSHQVLRRRFTSITAVIALALSIGGFGFYRWQVERQHARAEASLRDRDLGRFVLALEQFDWDPMTLAPIVVRPDPDVLSWKLHSPDSEDLNQPGREFDVTWVVRNEVAVLGNAIVQEVEAHGGPAFLVVSRGPCKPSVVPLRALPGYAFRLEAPVLRIRVPTCRATLAGTVLVPAGEFIFGGVGDPPAPIYDTYPTYAKERRVDLPAFAIDRTEVTNAQFEIFAEMSQFTGIARAGYANSPNLGPTGKRDVPATGIDWREARAFCRFLGKDLPTTEQWTKAFRGPVVLPDGRANPAPRRNLPSGTTTSPSWVTSGTVVSVGHRPDDTSPLGVVDMAGNVGEWTSSLTDGGLRVVRGGNWEQSTTMTWLLNLIVLNNPRAEVQRLYTVGVRCVSNQP